MRKAIAFAITVLGVLLSQSPMQAQETLSSPECIEQSKAIRTWDPVKGKFFTDDVAGELPSNNCKSKLKPVQQRTRVWNATTGTFDYPTEAIPAESKTQNASTGAPTNPSQKKRIWNPVTGTFDAKEAASQTPSTLVCKSSTSSSTSSCKSQSEESKHQDSNAPVTLNASATPKNSNIPDGISAGARYENISGNKAYAPLHPGATKTKYWFGWFWTNVDWNRDGLNDLLYTGTMVPKDRRLTGVNTGGTCGGKSCPGDMPGPTLFIAQKDGTYKDMSSLFRDERKRPGQSLARQNIVADFNGDDIPDLFIADTGLGSHKGFRDSYFLSRADGTWLESSATHLNDPAYVVFDHGAAAGDIDNDGDVDIVITTLSNLLICWINDGRGSMSKRRCGSVNAFGIELGDVNGDGYLDIVHAGHEYEQFSTPTGITLNDGRGTFSKEVSLPTVKNWGTVPEVAIWDLDDDGDLDIVTSRAGKLYVGTGIQVLENVGKLRFKSTFIPIVEAPPGYKANHEANPWNSYVENIRFGDANGDSRTDIILVGGGTSDTSSLVRAAILKNDGNMKFMHIPYGKPGNPIRLLDETSFRNDPMTAAELVDVEYGDQRATKWSKAFKKYTDGKNVEKVNTSEFTELSRPLSLKSSGASIVGVSKPELHSDWLSYDILVKWADIEFAVSVCVQYYPDRQFTGTRVGFSDKHGFGGIEELKEYGTNNCVDKSGYAGDWELKSSAQQIGLSAFLGDLQQAGRGIISQIPQLSLEEKGSILAHFQ